MLSLLIIPPARGRRRSVGNEDLTIDGSIIAQEEIVANVKCAVMSRREREMKRKREREKGLRRCLRGGDGKC